MSSAQKFPLALLLVSIVLSGLIGLVIARGGSGAATAAREEPVVVLALDPAAAAALKFDAAEFETAARAGGVRVKKADPAAADFATTVRQGRVLVLVLPNGFAPPSEPGSGVFTVAAGNLVTGDNVDLFVAPGDKLAARTAAAAVRLALGRPVIAPTATAQGSRSVPTIP